MCKLHSVRKPIAPIMSRAKEKDHLYDRTDFLLRTGINFYLSGPQIIGVALTPLMQLSRFNYVSANVTIRDLRYVFFTHTVNSASHIYSIVSFCCLLKLLL